jgi:hypothetical protein
MVGGTLIFKSDSQKNKINKKERNNKEQFITLNRKHASTKNRCDGQSS